MTDSKIKPEEPEHVSCQICLKEIPRDLAKNDESVDYVYHFCGQDCFDKWKKNGTQKTGAKKEQKRKK